jgi:hypothetical protein
MVTSCDPINPYTVTNTFGVPYNGGYKPDKSLQWIPPDTNVVGGDEKDDFMPPPVLPPPNMLMQTCEGRRMDPRVGGIPKREMDFDDFTQSQEIAQVPPPVPFKDSVGPVINNEEDLWRLMMMLAVLLFVLLAVTRFS